MDIKTPDTLILGNTQRITLVYTEPIETIDKSNYVIAKVLSWHKDFYHVIDQWKGETNVDMGSMQLRDLFKLPSNWSENLVNAIHSGVLHIPQPTSPIKAYMPGAYQSQGESDLLLRQEQYPNPGRFPSLVFTGPVKHESVVKWIRDNKALIEEMNEKGYLMLGESARSPETLIWGQAVHILKQENDFTFEQFVKLIDELDFNGRLSKVIDDIDLSYLKSIYGPKESLTEDLDGPKLSNYYRRFIEAFSSITYPEQ